MDRFKDKVVIVTGAASGIGEATTRRIVSEGGMVVMADFAKEKTALLAQDLKAEKAEVYPVYFSAENLVTYIHSCIPRFIICISHPDIIHLTAGK